MKKKLLILTIVLMLMVLVALPVNAADVTASVNSVTAVRGDTVTFELTLGNSITVISCGVSLSYDDTALRLESGEWTLEQNPLITNFDMNTELGAIAYMSETAISGTVFKATFKVLDGAAFDTTSVEINLIPRDKDGADLSVDLTSGSLTVECRTHDFSAKDTSAKYQKSAATCTAPAVYYYSCAHCGAVGTATFEDGNPVPHSFTKKVATEAYLKSAATCTAKAVYYYCCETCDAKGTETYEYGDVLPHTFDQKNADDKYLKSKADCEHAAVYYMSCACGEKGTETFTSGNALGHTGGTATCTAKAVCTRCGNAYGELLAHNFTQEKVEEKYLKSAATCTAKATYYKSCSVCGEKGTETFEYGSTLPHTFTKKVTTEAYLKSAATCTAKAVYYYCCETCDAKGTETYEDGDVLPHTFDQKNTDDKYLKSAADCEHAAVYYLSCVCGEKGTETFTSGNALGHTGGTATCTAKAVCTRCGNEYGELLAHDFTQEKVEEKYLNSAATCTAKATYYKSCSACGEKGTTTFEYGDLLPHDFTKKTESDAYLKSAATCTAKAVYYYSCSVCGEKGTETFETGPEPSHNYKTTWSSNSKEHWHECSKCGDKKDTEAHIPGDPATEYTAQTCKTCGYVIVPAYGHTHNFGSEWKSDSSKHWHACSGCSDHGSEADHVFDNSCDTTCNVCGYVRTITHSYTTEWKKDATGHWHECSVCHEKSDETAHTPGAEPTENTAQTCTVCGYVIKEALGHTHAFGTEWKSDGTSHWHVCSCGEKSDVAAHVSTGDNVATCTKKAVCDICGVEYGELKAHSYGSEWKSDADKHWHECDCGAKGDEAGHTWDSGVVEKEATATETGVKKYTCTVCGQEKTESIDKLSGSDTSASGGKKNGCKSSITLGLLIPAVFVPAIVFGKKKRS